MAQEKSAFYINNPVICISDSLIGFSKNEKYNSEKVCFEKSNFDFDYYRIYYSNESYDLFSLHDFSIYFQTLKELRKLKLEKIGILK